MSLPQLDYHIIILGGGIIGLSLANKLAPLGLNIAIIDQGKFTASAGHHYDLRVVAINRGSEQLFREIQAWENITTRYSPYLKMKVWEPNGGHIEFNCREVNQPNLGYIIEQNVILDALIKRASTFPNLSLIPNETAKTLEVSSSSVSLALKKGDPTLKGKLLIGADGKNSWLRQQLGIPTAVRDYHHHALVTHVRSEKPHDKTAYQVFLTTGTLAFLPLSDPYVCSIVWSLPPDLAHDLKELPTAEFEDQLAKAAGGTLGKLKVIAPLATFPLHEQHARQYCQSRVALIGDAAHTVHPLAGLGMNLGLRDVAALARHIEKAYWEGRDWGLMKTLSRYERERHGDNMLMLKSISGIKDLFMASNPLISFIRNAGLSWINQTDWLKQLFIKKALGLISVADA